MNRKLHQGEYKMNKIERMNKVGDKVFLNPSPLLSYDKLAKCSLGPNTYRGFHRIDKNQDGASKIFSQVFGKKRSIIQDGIRKVNSENDLDNLLKGICKNLLGGLKANIRADQLTSFNKIRKPMDIVIQHMVAMGEDFNDARPKVTDLLFLPLDSQMFQSDFVFSDQEVKHLRIKRTFTFTNIECESHYADIQAFLREKADRIGLNHRIYFDLIWNDRYKSSGTNLFFTNPN